MQSFGICYKAENQTSLTTNILTINAQTKHAAILGL
jgi:hypothetical protein